MGRRNIGAGVGLITGGGNLVAPGIAIGAGRTRQSHMARAISEVTEKKRKALLSQINEDRTISDETRAELLAAIKPGESNLRDIQAAGSRFNKAKKGTDPLFKSRQVLQERREILKDRPGRRQTLLGSFSGGGSGGTLAGGGKG